MILPPDPNPGQLLLMAGSRAALHSMLPAWMARQALHGPLRVLDGGNCFNAYGVARALRRLTSELQPALERISISRAFTCYQLLTLLAQTAGRSIPTLLLEPLSTFADESVPKGERARLWGHCLMHLRRLRSAGPAAVSVTLHSSLEPVWLQLLLTTADHTWRDGTPLPAPPAPQLL